MKLNRGQDEAIKHGNGPCMVLAPPGSGKTLIVTELYPLSDRGEWSTPGSDSCNYFYKNMQHCEMKRTF